MTGSEWLNHSAQGSDNYFDFFGANTTHYVHCVFGDQETVIGSYVPSQLQSFILDNNNNNNGGGY